MSVKVSDSSDYQSMDDIMVGSFSWFLFKTILIVF